jgi:hypothetical protein
LPLLDAFGRASSLMTNLAKGKFYPIFCSEFELEKVYFTPSTIGGGLLNLLNYETVYSTPELSKSGQITPQTVFRRWLLQYHQYFILWFFCDLLWFFKDSAEINKKEKGETAGTVVIQRLL